MFWLIHTAATIEIAGAQDPGLGDLRNKGPKVRFTQPMSGRARGRSGHAIV